MILIWCIFAILFVNLGDMISTQIALTHPHIIEGNWVVRKLGLELSKLIACVSQIGFLFFFSDTTTPLLVYTSALVAFYLVVILHNLHAR